jgi:hypothetical protein
MPIIDAVHVFETVGGIALWMSAIAFILLGVFVELRRKSTSVEAPERRPGHKLDLVAKTEKRPVSKKAPARKAA